jgi:hypothetical protein
VKINGMKSRLAGGCPCINAFTVDLGIVSDPYSKGRGGHRGPCRQLTIGRKHGATFDLTPGQFVKGLVYLLEANALDAATKQSLAGKSQHLTAHDMQIGMA